MIRAGDKVHQQWTRSAAYRVTLIAALAYAVLRLAVHGAYLTMMLYPGSGIMGGMPEWTGAEAEPMVPVDLQVYLDAAENLIHRKDLYLSGPITRLEDLYQYTPAFALAFVPFLAMSPAGVSLVHTLVHIAAYVALYVTWDRILREAGMEQARTALAHTLPVWLVFSPFWSDLGYLNIYIPMALLGTLLLRSVLRRELFWSVVWLSLILQSKPQWAFAAVVPLLLGRWRFFLKLVGWSILAYAGIMGATMSVAGPSYVGEQYAEYVRSLWTLSGRFPWRGPDAPFLGYNHSVKQIMLYLLGKSSRTLRLVTWVKVLLLLPAGVVTGKYLLNALRGHRRTDTRRGIGLALLLYLGAFIWLDMVWELSLGIAVFVYLLATSDEAWIRYALWGIFMPYALVDLWQLLSLGLFGMEVIAPGPYVLTDPSIYVPVVMVVILVFYFMLLQRSYDTALLRSDGNPGLTGLFQTAVVIGTGVLYYTVDFWLMQRHAQLRRDGGTGRSWGYTTLMIAALIFLSAQPLIMPQLGLRIPHSWGLATQVVGLLILALAFLLHWWSRTHLRQFYVEDVVFQDGHILVETGPYRYVRHPIFTSFLMIATGLLLVNPAVPIFLGMLYAFWDFTRAAKEEEALLHKKLDGYAAYAERTGRFLPRLRERD